MIWFLVFVGPLTADETGEKTPRDSQATVASFTGAWLYDYTRDEDWGPTEWKQLRVKRDGRKIEMQSLVYSRDHETSSDFVNYEILDEWEGKDHGVLLLGEKPPFYVWSWSFRPLPPAAKFAVWAFRPLPEGEMALLFDQTGFGEPTLNKQVSRGAFEEYKSALIASKTGRIVLEGGAIKLLAESKVLES